MTYQWHEIDIETPVVELRRYRLRPGRRDTLIGMFEEHFIEPQEAAGSRIVGSFRVDGDPDGFVWLRGFTHHAARPRALADFYGGPVWQARRDAANATMVDSDDVHLLRAISPGTGLPALRLPRRDECLPALRHTLVVSDLRYPEWLGSYHLWLRLFLRKLGADPMASFATLMAENNYPALPVWRDRPVHVALIRSAAPLPPLPPELGNLLRAAPEIVTLTPTARSRLR